MPDTATARCHCGAVEMEAAFPSRFVAHCYCWSCRATHAAGVVTFQDTAVTTGLVEYIVRL